MLGVGGYDVLVGGFLAFLGVFLVGPFLRAGDFLFIFSRVLKQVQVGRCRLVGL